MINLFMLMGNHPKLLRAHLKLFLQKASGEVLQRML